MTKLWTALRSGHLGTLISALLYFDFSFMVWVLVGALGIFIAGDLHLTAAQKGLVVALPAFGGAIFRVTLGFLSDRYGPKRVGIFSMTAMLIPLAWGWLGATTFTQLLGVGLLLGIAGGSFAVAMPLASRAYPREHQGVAMGIAGAGNSGTVIAALLGPRLAIAFGWHAVFALAMIPVAAALLLFMLVAREAPLPPQQDTLRRSLRLLRQPDLWRFSLFYSLTFGGFVGLAGFLAIYLHDQYGAPPVLAGTLTAACVFGGSFFRPVGGYLADRIGGVRLLYWLLPLIGVAFVAASFSKSLAVSVALLVIGMMAQGAGNGAVFQLVPERFHNEIGVVSGIVGAAGSLGGSLFPLVLGTLKQWTGTYAAGFACYVLAAQLAMIPLFYYQRSRQHRAVQTAPGELHARSAAAASKQISAGTRVRMRLATPPNA